VLTVSRWTSNYFRFLPLLILPFVVLDGAVYLTLRRRYASRIMSVLWSLLMFLVALAAIAFLVLALILPGARVWQGLFN
jgi:hypothetical protein